MSRKVGWGIMGCANIAKKNVLAIAQTSNSKLVAVASRDLERARAWCKEQNLGSDVAALGSYDELLARADVQAVYVPLPTRLHVEWAVKCAAAKKHVLLEKPTALNAAELRTIIAACVENNVQLMDGVMFMHHARLRDMDRSLRGPIAFFGDVERVTSGFSFMGDQRFLLEDIRCRRDGDPLGCVGDLGWYCIRIGLFAFNYAWPHSVVARANASSPDQVPIDVDTTVYFDAAKKHVLTFHCSFTTLLRQWVEIVGTRKRVTCDDFVIASSPYEVTHDVQNYPDSGQIITDCATRCFASKDVVRTVNCVQEAEMFRTFSDIVFSNSPVNFWPYVALATQIITDAAMTSLADSGREVPLGPAPEETFYRPRSLSPGSD